MVSSSGGDRTPGLFEGPRATLSSLSLSNLELSDTNVYETSISALLRTAAHVCQVVVINGAHMQALAPFCRFWNRAKCPEVGSEDWETKSATPVGYRSVSLIRKCLLLRPFSRHVSKVPWCF